MLGVELIHLSALSILFPVILGAISFQLLPNSFKILSIYVFISCIMEIWTTTLFLKEMNNLFLFHIHTYVEITSIAAILLVVSKKKFNKWFIGSTYIGFIVTSLFFYWNGDSVDFFNSKQRIIETIIIIGWLVVFFQELLHHDKNPFIELNPHFIWGSGLFIYFSGTLVLTTFSDVLNQEYFVTVWSIHSILNIFLNIIYTIVIWKSRKLTHLS